MRKCQRANCMHSGKTREKREYERKGEKLTGNGKKERSKETDRANRINYLMEMKNGRMREWKWNEHDKSTTKRNRIDELREERREGMLSARRRRKVKKQTKQQT